MSIEVMTKVWEYSAQKGSALLLMIAIADNANKAGECWPGMEYLAEKTRLSRRQVQRLLYKLEDEGELAIEYGVGRGYSHLIYVLTGLDPDDQARIAAEVQARNAARGRSRENAEPEPGDDAADGEKGDKMSSFSEDEKLDTGDRNVDIQGIKSDIFSGNVDIAMSTEPINPLTNQTEPKRPMARSGQQPPAPPSRGEARSTPTPPNAGRPPSRGEPPPDGLPDPDVVWNLIAGALRAEMSRSNFDTWVRDLVPTGWRGTTLRVSAANEYARDWVSNRIASMAIRTLCGLVNRSDCSIEFFVPGLT